MPYSRKQVVACVSIVYLILSTALSGYAASRTNRLSIPIPSALSGVTTILPAIAGLLLGGGYEFTRHQERHQSIPRGQTPRPPLVIVANTLIFIYSSVVITLLGTHVGPPLEVNCRLAQRWSDMFSHKKDEAIRTIQDTFKCCGHMNSHDKAWPFPDRGHDIHACENAFGRTIGCHGPWKQEEQRLAGIMMAVVGLVFVWQFAIIVTPTRRESWLHRILPDRVSRIIADEEHGNSNRTRRAIGYLSASDRYSDNVAEEVDDEENNSTARRAIDEGVQQVRNVLPGTENEEERQHAIGDNVWSRN